MYSYGMNVSLYTISGIDYEAVSMPVDLTGNQSTAVISIPILDDILAEGYEIIGGRLEVVSQSLNLSFTSIIKIEIIDDEGKFSLIYHRLTISRTAILLIVTISGFQLKEFVGICLQVAIVALTLFAESAQMEEAYRAASVEKGLLEAGSFAVVG